MQDWMVWLQALFLGIVEGLTEFLPVSSTGHLIVAGDLIGFGGDGADTFYIAIQSGAIVAVCWEYRNRILAILRGLFRDARQMNLVINTLVAFAPAVVLGVLFSSVIKHYLFNPLTVAATLVVGGVLIFWVEGLHKRGVLPARVAEMDDMNWKDALKVGCLQCLAMVPGTSRSGATIIGGMAIGLSRKAATEFSFFLAIPTIFGATVWDLWKSRAVLGAANLPALAIGTVVSFFVALVVVRWLLRFVATNDFRGFGWYRIAFGGFIALTWWSGLVRW